MRAATIASALLLVVFVDTRSVDAAEFEVFSLSQQSIEASRLENPIAGTAEEDLTFAVTRRDAKLVFPLSFAGGDTVLLNTLAINEFTVEIGNIPLPAPPDLVERFYGRSYSLTLIQKLSSDYRLTVIASIGRFADRDPPQKEDERTTGGLILHRTFGESLSIGFGAIETSDSGEPQLVPALQYKFEGDLLKVNLALPNGLDVRLVPGGNWQYGANVRVQGNQYRVTESATIDRLKYSEGTAGLFVVIGPTPGLQLTVTGGSTFRRRYDTLLGETEVRSVDLRNANFIEAKLGVVF